MVNHGPGNGERESGSEAVEVYGSAAAAERVRSEIAGRRWWPLSERTRDDMHRLLSTAGTSVTAQQQSAPASDDGPR